MKKLLLINAASIYYNIFISDSKSNVLFSLNPDLKKMDSTTVAFVREAVEKRKIINTDLHYCPTYNEISLNYIAPVIDKNNIVIAVIIFQIHPNNYLYPLIEKWPVPSSTSETLLVSKDGNYVLFLNELKHRFNTALKLRIPLTDKNNVSVQAVLGRKGIFEGYDYEGNKVLAYIMDVPNMPWFVVAQVDISEIYSVLYFREVIIISFTILLITITILGLMWFYHYRQRNIYKELFVKEKELREYHQEFRTILYSIGDGVITTDTNGNIKQMNHTSEELTGWSETEAIGQPVEKIFRIMNEETKSIVENPVHKVLNEGVITGLANHTLLVSKDGREIPITDSGAPIRDEHGKIEGVVLVFHDKTYEYYSEKIIRESEARLKRAEFVTNAGHWELHLDSGDMIISEGASKIFGLERTQLKIFDIQKNVLYNYSSKLMDALNKLTGQNQPFDIEFKIKKAGTDEIVDVHAIAEYNKETRIVFGIFQDVTKTKQFEAALKESEYKFRTLVEDIKIGIYYSDFGGTFLYGNHEAEEIVGYNRSELIGKNFMELNLLGKKQKIKAALLLGKNLIGKSTGPDEFIINRKDGTQRIVEISTNVINAGFQKLVCGVALDITERKRIEDALIMSENKYRHLFENNPLPMWIYDLKSLAFLEVNGSAILHYGYSKNEFLNMTLKDIRPEEDVETLLQDVANTYKEINRAGIWRHKKKNGEIIFAEIISHLIKYENKDARLVLSHDVTEQKLAEEALKESYEFNKSLLKTIPFGMQIVDETGNIIFISDNLKNLFSGNVIGRKCWELYMDDKTQCKHCPLKIGINAGETLELEVENILNGKTFQINHTGMIYRGSRAVLEIFQDITGRKNAEQTINLLAQAVKNTSDCVSITDTENNIQFINESFLKTYGYEEKELIGKNIELVRASANTEPSSEIIKNATLQNGWFGELLNRKKDGTEFPILLSTSSVLNDKGEPYALIGIARDITDYKRAEQELRKYREHLEELVETRTVELDRLNSDLIAQLQKEKELEMMLKQSLAKEKELNELKTRFISTTSHEFRTPLTSVLSSAELIQRYSKKWSEEKRNEYLDKIKKSVDYLTKLLDDVLTISRTESGKILFKPDMVDLHKLCAEIIEETKSNIHEKNDFVFNFSIRKIKYSLDARLIKFILTNLLSNAFKYSPEGGKVELSIVSMKDWIQISVADEGIGIPDEDMKRLFEPFHRGANATEIQGTGLGLSIVKHSVDLHKGKINIQSELGRGTTVTVEIPKRQK